MSNRKKQIDVKEILNDSINQPEKNDLNYRRLVQNGATMQSVTPPNLQTPTTSFSHRRVAAQPKKQNDIHIKGMPRNEREHQTPQERHEHKSEIGIEDTYLLFDSFYKEKNSIPGEGYYVWDVVRMNNFCPVSNVVKATLEQFILPTVATESYQPDMLVAGRVYMYMENIGAPQYIASSHLSNVNRFHWSPIVMPTEVANGVLVSPQQDSEYIFTEPINSITRLEMRFKIPFGNIPFAEDTFDATALASAGPSPVNRRIVTTAAHGLTPAAEVDIYVVGFNSTNNELNRAINNPRGHKVTVVDGVTLEFTDTPLADSIGASATADGGVPTCVIYIIARRIAFTIKFRSIVTAPTNFIAP